MSLVFTTYTNCVCILLLLFLISLDKKSMATSSSSSSSSFLSCPQAQGRKESLFPFLLNFFLEFELELCLSNIPKIQWRRKSLDQHCGGLQLHGVPFPTFTKEESRSLKGLLFLYLLFAIHYAKTWKV